MREGGGAGSRSRAPAGAGGARSAGKRWVPVDRRLRHRGAAAASVTGEPRAEPSAQPGARADK